MTSATHKYTVTLVQVTELLNSGAPYTAVMMAYGITASGKTYTIEARFFGFLLRTLFTKDALTDLPIAGNKARPRCCSSGTQTDIPSKSQKPGLYC